MTQHCWHLQAEAWRLLHSDILVGVQTALSETEAGGFCREEFQAFTKYYANPLIQRAIRERYNKPESKVTKVWQQMTFCDIVDAWRSKLSGAYECIVPGETPVHQVPATHWPACPCGGVRADHRRRAVAILCDARPQHRAQLLAQVAQGAPAGAWLSATAGA